MTTYAATPVEAGCVRCAFQARDVPVKECDHCKRGFVVRIEGQTPFALCPTDTSEACVGDIMSTRTLAARPHMPIESLILLLVDEDVQSVPVVDDDHRPVGMASKSDLVFDHYEWAELRDETLWLKRLTRLPAGPQTEGDLHLEELLRSHTVGDIMSQDPLTVTPQTRIVDAARQLSERHVHGCPVVDGTGRLIGSVTTLDITRWVAAQTLRPVGAR
jgi:CBS domain-containing protein